MIFTFTPNPSVDVTFTVDSLTAGEVIRVTTSSREPGGKGINVAHALLKAGESVLALAPAHDTDPFVALAHEAHIPLRTVAVDGNVRANTTITDATGVTTKLNEQGARLTPDTIAALEDAVATSAAMSDVVVLAGSLPPGAPYDWYSTLVAVVRQANSDALIAVDTSDEPLIALSEGMDQGTPDIIKPNGYELGQLAGIDGHTLEDAASNGDLCYVVEVARSVVCRGVPELLVTLGSAGACLVTADGAWVATPPPSLIRSTVGAGDSALAGYVLARIRGLDSPEALRHSVAYGTAAASNPGTAIPTPHDLDLEHTVVSTFPNQGSNKGGE
ncbi:1-phosphofructokinase family hexose kinase [Corynebacterium tuscaniense]|uniref:1-phosphofructokinase family hexose kinase n=1 Tax=Corynebacterium tuscaniense TaxID=302449 RepID=UPI0012384DCF|nr:1-phosphofructokinase family hexose kinase [Corynebacterium tuscaniense]KAA8745081.1 1-phosphofructokinase family hexose kinase [Corynebacterium tuscaniense]